MIVKTLEDAQRIARELADHFPATVLTDKHADLGAKSADLVAFLDALSESGDADGFEREEPESAEPDTAQASKDA